MKSQIALLDPRLLDSSLLLEGQQRAVERILEHVRAYSDFTAQSSASDSQNPNHVISLMGDRGAGKTTVLLNLIERLRSENPSWIVSAPFLPDLISDRNALAPAIVSALQAALKAAAGDAAEIIDEISTISSQLAWFSDPQVAHDVIVRDSVSTRDFAQRTFEYYGKSHSLSDAFKAWLTKILQALNKKYLIFVVDDADIAISLSESVLDFVRYYLSIPQIITVFSADEASLKRRIFNKRLSSLDILQGLPESEGFSLMGMSGQDYKRREVEHEIRYVDALLTKVLPPATRVYLDQLTVADRLNHRFRLGAEDKTPSMAELLGELVVSSRFGEEPLSVIANRCPGIFASNLRSFVNQYALIYEVIDAYKAGDESQFRKPKHADDQIEFVDIDLEFNGASGGIRTESAILSLVNVLLKSPVHRPWLQFFVESLHIDLLSVGSLSKIVGPLLLRFRVSGSSNFNLRYAIHSINLDEVESTHILNLIFDLAAAGGLPFEQIVTSLEFYKDDSLPLVSISSNLSKASQDKVADLSCNVIFYENSSRPELAGALQVNASGSALAPFYVINTFLFGIYAHVAYQSRHVRDVSDRERSYVEDIKESSKAKRSRAMAVRSTERKRAYFAVYSMYSNATLHFSCATAAILDKAVFGKYRVLVQSVVNTALEWRVSRFTGFWEVLSQMLAADDVTLGQKLAFMLVISELPYEILANVTDTNVRKSRDVVPGLVEAFRKELGELGLWSEEDGAVLSDLRDLSAREARLQVMHTYGLHWPSIEWTSKEGSLTRFLEFICTYELDEPWEMRTSPPPRWKAWVDAVINDLEVEEHDEGETPEEDSLDDAEDDVEA